MSDTFFDKTTTTTTVFPNHGIPDRETIRTVKMTPAQWAAIADNPRQRDTERRLKNATHLFAPAATHSVVSLAYCEATNQSWKLDGHTRSFLWTRQPNLAPSYLTVTVYPVTSELEAAELYSHFDNQLATETPFDRLTGAHRQLAWTPVSNFFKNTNYSLAIAAAQGVINGNINEVRIGGRTAETTIYEILPNWLPELKALDELNLVSSKFKSSILLAALLTLRRRGVNDKTIAFWRAYNSDQGIKLEDRADGVEALTRLVQSTKLNNRADRYQLASRAISCFESWRLRRDYVLKGRRTTAPKSTDIIRYMAPKVED